MKYGLVTVKPGKQSGKWFGKRVHCKFYGQHRAITHSLFKEVELRA